MASKLTTKVERLEREREKRRQEMIDSVAAEFGISREEVEQAYGDIMARWRQLVGTNFDSPGELLVALVGVDATLDEANEYYLEACQKYNLDPDAVWHSWTQEAS